MGAFRLVRFFKSQEEKEQIDAARADFDTFITRAGNEQPDAVRAMAQTFRKNQTGLGAHGAVTGEP